MQTRSSLQRRSNSESSDRVVVHIKPRSWGDEIHQQPQTVQPQNTGFDFKNADWFSHDPGPRSPVRVFNTIQAKLKVGAPNDQYEQEADRVAEQVMSTPDSAVQQPIQRDMAPEEDKLQTKPLAATITPLVQREMAPEEEEEPGLIHGKLIQREIAPEGEEETELVQGKPAIQWKESPAGLQAQSGLEQQLDSSKGSGSPLPDDVRSFMEPRFGADFSQVRVHTGGEAVQMNQDLNAQAFTHKQDVYFGAGKAPANDALTAHELTHIVQQTGNDDFPVQSKCSICQQQDEQLRRYPEDDEDDYDEYDDEKYDERGKRRRRPEGRSRGARPRNCPQGTVPIDESGLDRGDVHTIKDGVGAGADDWVGVTPDGHIVTGDGKGDMVDHGPKENILPKSSFAEEKARTTIPGWVWAILGVAATAAVIGCFAIGVCEFAALATLAGATAYAVIVGILRASGIHDSGGEESTA